MKFKSILTAFFLAAISLNIWGQEGKSETQSLIESKQFQFVADRATTQSGRSIDMTTNSNYLKITDSLAKGYLPFFGTSTRADYASGGGAIEFDGEMQDYQIKVIEKKKRTTIRVNFKVKAAADSYSCQLSISSSGFATLSVTSIHRSHINYTGKVSAIE